MKRLDHLQEELKSLPTFTLSNEQKEHIKMKIRRGAKIKKRVEFLKPAISILAICSIAFLLFIASNEENKDWIKQAFQPRVSLTAAEGFVFKAEPYEVLGIEGKVGILVMNNQFIAEDTRRGSKLMLYFWGESAELVGKSYRVEAINDRNQQITLAEGILGSSLYSEDAHQLTRFAPFPSAGKWEISFYIENQLFEAFTHNVLPPLPKTKNYTVITPPLEIPIGKKTELGVESIKDDKEITVKLVDQKGDIHSEYLFTQQGSAIRESTLSPVYFYEGSILFPKKGKWSLIINGEKTKPFHN